MTTKNAASKSEGKGIDKAILAGVPVTVEAVLGLAQVTVAGLTALAPGDSFTIDRKLGDPIELKLNGVTIAYGELVSVGDNFGVRIQAVAGE